MSRNVDLDNLSPDDAQYLTDRPYLIAEAKLQGVSDIEDRVAEALDPDPTPEVVTSDEDVSTSVNYDALNLGDARRLAVSRGLSADGSKKAILARLQAADVATGVTATVSREAEGAVEAADGGSDDEAGE